MIGLPRGVLGLQLPNSIMIEKRIEETGPIVAQSKDVLAKPAREQHVEASLVLPQLSVGGQPVLPLKTGAPGRFDRHRPVASPRSGVCRRRCRRFGFSARAGKTPSSNGIPRSRAETWIQARAAPGPECASPLRHGSPGLDSGPVPSISSSARPELDRSPVCRDHAYMISSFVRARLLARSQTQTLSC